MKVLLNVSSCLPWNDPSSDLSFLAVGSRDSMSPCPGSALHRFFSFPDPAFPNSALRLDSGLALRRFYRDVRQLMKEPKIRGSFLITATPFSQGKRKKQPPQHLRSWRSNSAPLLSSYFRCRTEKRRQSKGEMIKRSQESQHRYYEQMWSNSFTVTETKGLWWTESRDVLTRGQLDLSAYPTLVCDKISKKWMEDVGE